ncbi:hypothetical protein DI09_89p40 [Mitosporidium daphniae]|uniref:C2H2-type domain-containing protein n=1 Tax=Mitosporidium daphniae TaxID=1485682 RepID=A0A098VMB5_9MICR|nr:uncharacterized protein DI09_89p40 [Mitosporidium daphniae]KGG50110.1 hypothetical protein DI09_89p40 [Mitosporidium daphniae]|eukprot:XP_013236546.1 uncharacterized protein DI09_89p40 [Mitosporidium daphniae]
MSHFFLQRGFDKKNRLSCTLGAGSWKKLFFEEIPLFENPFTLRSHMRTIEEKKRRKDNIPQTSPIVQIQKKLIGHPECKFCSVRFYSNDELYTHCRDAHESCFICISNEIKDQYYKNYESLPCLEKKFVVFSTVIDLKGHMANQHPELYRGGQRSQNRHILSIDLSKKDSPASSTQEPSRETRKDISTPFVLSEDSFPSLAPINSSMPLISKRKPAVLHSKEKLFPSLSSLRPSAMGPPSVSASAPKISFPEKVPLSKPSSLPASQSLKRQESRAEAFPELPKRENTAPAVSTPNGPPPGLSFPNKSEKGKLRVLRLP